MLYILAPTHCNVLFSTSVSHGYAFLLQLPWEVSLVSQIKQHAESSCCISVQSSHVAYTCTASKCGIRSSLECDFHDLIIVHRVTRSNVFLPSAPLPPTCFSCTLMAWWVGQGLPRLWSGSMLATESAPLHCPPRSPPTYWKWPALATREVRGSGCSKCTKVLWECQVHTRGVIESVAKCVTHEQTCNRQMQMCH